MTYKEKLQQASKEARAAVIGLIGTIIVWIVLGFGVYATGIVIGSTPLWIITGLFGPFLFAIGVAVYLAKVVMKDVGLDDIEPIQADAVKGDAHVAR